MISYRLSLALGLLCLAGCASSRPTALPTRTLSGAALHERVNRVSTSQLVVIEQIGTDGSPVEPVLGRGFAVRLDSARWYDPATSRRHAISTGSLAAVTVNNQSRRLIKRGAVGLFTGLMIGGIYNQLNDPADNIHGTWSSTPVFGGLGLFTGLIWWFGNQPDTRYTFPVWTPPVR